ncbi:winged helix-turn-helix domain-containing protein [Pseudoalteromonas ostreae]|uniref:winged helix-turn-helix domain-containing protein n=1 Tax=Pseudoalteromonas ostreae TaxID=2774154 RepID=UPI001B37C97F|nr:winged helix-turn-helix domain-containing protein [Pseudoalteromonas ostreae]
MTTFILKGYVIGIWIGMRWKIEGFEFSEQHQMLCNEQNMVRIEPMVGELLTYFCRHPNQVISKQQLLDNVWHGRYVSDNTVSKLITKLRKVLQDDARNPQFIVTIPKRGYRFIASATQLTDSTDFLTKQDISYPKRWIDKRVQLLLLPLTFASLFWFYFSDHSPANTFISAKAVTTDIGSEYFPSFAQDGIRLAYMNNNGEKFKLFVKNIISGEQVEINHGEENGVGPGSWNDKGTKLVYLVASPENCQYFISEFDGLVMSKPKLIHTCKAGSYGAIKFTHDDNIVIFSESPGMNKPYSLYSLNINSGKTQWLPQPELHLEGNSQFDLHPTENKLLISSPNQQQWEGFYQLDLETQQLNLLFKLNAYICCGIWSHDGKHVVMMGEHPAREIVQYSLNGSDKTILFTSSQQLHRPERHSNGVDYAFSVFEHDINVDEYNISEDKTQSILNDTFDERLAVLSPSTKQVAYISLTTGNEELWLYDRETKKKKKITQFADGRHYIDLTWSPGEQSIAGVTLNSIHVITTTTGETKVLPLPEKEFRGVSFKSLNIISFSIKLDSNWQVVEFNLDDNSMERIDSKWRSIQYTSATDNWLWNDQDGNWYHGEDATPLLLPKHNVNAFYGRQFNVKKSENRVAFYDPNKRKINIYDIESDKPVTTLYNQVGHFSLVGDVVLFSKNSSKINDSDIYQTYNNSPK